MWQRLWALLCEKGFPFTPEGAWFSALLICGQDNSSNTPLSPLHTQKPHSKAILLPPLKLMGPALYHPLQKQPPSSESSGSTCLSLQSQSRTTAAVLLSSTSPSPGNSSLAPATLGCIGADESRNSQVDQIPQII